MSEIQLKNKAIIKQLDSYVDEFFDRVDYKNELYKVSSHEYGMHIKPSYFMSEEFLREWKLNMPHSGFPEEHMAMPISNIVRHRPDLKDFEMRVRNGFSEEIGAHSSALFNYYPPEGGVGWHTNWNASAYQVLFTWSRDGNGFFRYYDKAKDKVVTIKDKPGWQARHYFFAEESDVDNHCWHAAYTESDRITLAYKFIGKEAIPLRDDLILELEDEKDN